MNKHIELGYGEVTNFFTSLNKAFKTHGNLPYIQLTEHVISFSSGISAIEFLGEARIALNKISSERPDIFPISMSKVIYYKKLLDDSFSNW